MADSPMTACRECGAPIGRVFSSFVSRSGASSPDPTPLNVTGIPAPSSMQTGEGCEGHEH